MLGRAGFATGSTIYERARPTYPAEAVAHLEGATGIGAGSRVLDLAAGTGKLTRQLSADGITCVAVEPSAAMREVFVRMVPGTPVIGGTAEMVPLANGSMDAVVVAQAFHWFDPAQALPEVVRVLRSRRMAGPRLERARRIGSGDGRIGTDQQMGPVPALSDGNRFRSDHRSTPACSARPSEPSSPLSRTSTSPCSSTR